MRHIKSTFPPLLDLYGFAYRPKRSGDNAISTALHSALSDLETKDPNIRILFIDFS